MRIAEIVWCCFSGHSVGWVKSYIKNRCFSKPNGNNQKGIISNHKHAHPELYIKLSKSWNWTLYLSESKNRKMRSGSLRKRNKQILQTDDPRSILDRSRFGHRIEKYENIIHFQLFGLADGHGQLQKPLKSDTSFPHLKVENFDDACE